MSAEAVNISAICRINSKSWNTTNRWLERARAACHRYQEKHLRGYEINEVQADEIKTFVGPCKKTSWILALIEVTTRPWPSSTIGSRNYKNIKELFGKAFHKGNIVG